MWGGVCVDTKKDNCKDDRTIGVTISCKLCILSNTVNGSQSVEKPSL